MFVSHCILGISEIINKSVFFSWKNLTAGSFNKCFSAQH